MAPLSIERARAEGHAVKIAALIVLAFAGVACNPSPRPLKTDSPIELSRFVRSTNSLAFDLYARARQKPGNLVLSPLAVSNDLAMLRAGARGETEAQIGRVLHAEGAADKTLDTAAQVTRSLGEPKRKFTLRFADRLFVDKGEALEPAQLGRFKTAFGTLVEPLDFAAASEASRRHINDWVAAETEDHIRDLLPEQAVSSLTSLVVAGALYFRGMWKERFPVHATRSWAFHMTPTEEKDVPMMRREASFRAAWTREVGVLELPYDGGELAMMVVIPAPDTDLSAVEAQLSPALLDQWALALRPMVVEVELPRFETTRGLLLGESLKALGMRLAFEPGADFTGIAGKGAIVAEVYHKVYVKVDEAGTQAAAAVGAPAWKAAYPTFRVDRPFLFFIREVHSRLILFMGRISDPTTP